MKKEKHILEKIKACKNKEELTNFSHLLIDRNKFMYYTEEIEEREKEIIKDIRFNKIVTIDKAKDDYFETDEEIKASGRVDNLYNVLESFGF